MEVAGKVVYGRMHREVGVMRPRRYIFEEDAPHASIEEDGLVRDTSCEERQLAVGRI